MRLVHGFIWAHFSLREKPGFSGVPVVNPLRGFTSGVLPTAKLHTGHKHGVCAKRKLQKQNRIDRRNVNSLCEFKLGPMMVLRPRPFNPLRTNRPVQPQCGGRPIPIIGTLITDFELITFEQKHYIFRGNPQNMKISGDPSSR
jgi:hypothetical protein